MGTDRNLHLLGADEMAEMPPAPRRDTRILPNGRELFMIKNPGVAWAPVTFGGAYVCFATGVDNNIVAWEMISPDASADQFDGVERRMFEHFKLATTPKLSAGTAARRRRAAAPPRRRAGA